MNLHQLEIFLAVARHQHFSKAAAELYLTQSAVSMQIKQLEEELGVPLFDRLGKKTHLTAAGMILEKHASRILGQVRALYQSMKELKGLESGSIAVGASTTPGIYILPPILGEYKRRYPQVELKYQIADTQQIEQMVLLNQLDFGVVGGHLIEGELRIEPYLTDELILVVGADHPFAKQQGDITLEALQGLPFVLRQKGSATRKVINEAFEKRGLKLNVMMELRDTESVKQMVIAGLGVTITSKYAVRFEVEGGDLVPVPVQEMPLTRQLVTVSHRDKRLSVAAQTLLTLIHT
ncbi:LysR family transcriptional regulator [Candidatus Poribacteria bacterium]|nr:LysR family transcriptional regulator [Candidatus Poribacteria bacterium]